MIKKITKIFLCLSFFSSIVSFSQWVIQPGSYGGLNSVSFIDANTGNIAGENGVILRTTNGGTNWVNQVSNQSASLTGIQMLNSNVGYACGWGPIIKTTNGGVNWFSITPGNPSTFYGINFIDLNTGFACGSGGIIIKTTNGGTNWNQQPDTTFYAIAGIKFYNANTGYAVGDVGTILKTTDGGNTWFQLVSGTTMLLHSLSVINSDTVYVCGYGIHVLKTTDGGNTFLPLNGSPGTSNLYDIYFTNANTGTIVGSGGLISRTINGGLNWINQFNPSGMNLFGLNFVTGDLGYAVGNTVILKTTTGGFSPPPPPNLQLPVSGTQNVSITPHLKWDTVNSSDVFNIQISSDSLFGNNVIFDSSGITDTFYNVRSGLLSNNIQYFWHVRSHNFVGFGSWSTTFNFTTIVALPGPPNLLLPAYGATNVSLHPLFKWDSTSPALYYRLQACYDSSFASGITPVDDNGIIISQLLLNNQTLRNNTRYYWRVNTTNLAGTGQWSNIFWFSTSITTPPQPILIAPPNNDTNVSLTPLLKWVEDISATNYTLQISKNIAFDTLVYSNNTITTSRFTVPVGVLSNYQKYYWRVQTTNNLGTSSWSDIWNFTTTLALPAPPQLISPFNGAVNVSLTPTLTWDVNPYSTYCIQVATDTLFTTQSRIVNQCGLSTPYYTINGGTLVNNATYYWRANATNNSGTGPWSVIWHFTTIVSAPVAPPILLSPQNGVTGVSATPTLDWSDVYGASSYRLILSPDSTFVDTLQYVIDSLTPVSQLTVRNGLLNSYTKYYWKARGENAGGFGPYALPWHFTTGPIGIRLLSMHIPAVFKLYNNYPNPFNPSTKIKFDIPEKLHGKNQISHVKMVIYDILGRLVNTIYEGELYPGSYEINWNAGSIASGIYLYRLVTDENAAVKKMVFLK